MYMKVIETKLYLWDLPNTSDGNLFLDILNDLFKDVYNRKCNMELPLLFIACILHKKRGLSMKRTKTTERGYRGGWTPNQSVALINSYFTMSTYKYLLTNNIES
jgi:hypothetical protein